MKIAFTGNVFPFGDGLAYGGERILYYLIQGLHNLGHEIYLFSREGTNVNPRYIKDYVPINPQVGVDVHYEAIMRYQKQHHIKFDVYQCNYFGDDWTVSAFDNFPVYVELTWNAWCHFHCQLKKPARNVVAYSKRLQEDFTEHLKCATTMIHYGLPFDLYQFEKNPDDYVVWIGKVEGGKAPELAIKVALAAGERIVLMGPPYNPGTFHTQIAPYLDHPNVFWVRGVDDEQKMRIMSKAKAFISSNDNTWREHFGIVNAEALAMGVPILAFNRIGQECAIWTDGIIKEGEQGFFLNYMDSNNFEEIIGTGVPLLKKILGGAISREACRRHFEENFTADLAALRYDWFYKYIKEEGPVDSIEIPF